MNRMGRLGFLVATLLILGGCGVPRFDLPPQSNGAPTIFSIVQQMTCELTDMVRADSTYQYKDVLLLGDYKFGALLSLNVTDTGELAPNFSFPDYAFGPLKNRFYSFNAGLRLNRSREQTFVQNFAISLSELRKRSDLNPKFGKCPTVRDTPLAGDLGIKDTVSLAFTAPFSNVDASLNGTSGEFGGSANIVLIREVNGVGVNWRLEHFNGPGNFATASRVNSDKITFAFAVGPGEDNQLSQADRRRALLEQDDRLKLFLQQQLLDRINTALPR